MSWRLPLLVLAGFVYAGSGGACSSASDVDTDRAEGDAPVGTVTTTAPVAVPAGFRLIEVEGFAVAVPEAWQAVPFNKEEIDKLLQAEGNGKPRLAESLETFRSQAGEDGKLLVIDTSGAGANFNVIRAANARRLTPAELGKARDDLLDPAVTGGIDSPLQAAGAQEVTREKVDLPTGPSIRTTYRLPVTTSEGARNVYGLQYYVPSAEAVFILSFSTPDPAAYQVAFDQITQSFSIR
jgi:hypothetical protein